MVLPWGWVVGLALSAAAGAAPPIAPAPVTPPPATATPASPPPAMPSARVTNPHVKAAEELIFNLQYDGAAAEVARGLHEPKLGRDARLRLLELQGLVQVSLSHFDAADASFRELAVLDPAHVAPSDWSPKVATRLANAIAAVKQQGHPLSATVSPGLGPDGRVAAVEVAVDDSALHLVRTIQVMTAAGPGPEVPVAAGAARTAVAPASAVDVWVELHGEQGQQLADVGDASHPVHLVGKPPVAAASGGFPYRAVGLVTAGVGVAALAVGVGFGAQVSSARGQINGATRSSANLVTGLSQQQAFSLAQGARNDATIANVLFVAGGVAAAAGVGLFVVGQWVVVAPAPSGVAIAGNWP